MTGFFTRRPVVEFLPDGRKVRIARSFFFVSGRVNRAIHVPEDFICDGASIPPILYVASGGPFVGKHRDAALVHDYLYAEHRAGRPIVNKTDADGIFYDAMRASGVNAFHARAKYFAVRLFGNRSWAK